MHYCACGDMVEGRKESVFPLFSSSKHGTIIFLLEPREGVDLHNGLCSNLCRDLSCCLASVMLKSLVSWSARAVKEEWDSRVGKWQQRKRMRGEEREKLKERERFCFLAPVIPDEIDSHSSRDLPLSPFSPPSITYLSRGWMIYTLPMSTADRYTHQWLPVLRDFTDTLKRQNRKDIGEEMEKGWVKERETIKAADGNVHGKEKVKVSQGETTKVTVGKKERRCD